MTVTVIYNYIENQQNRNFYLAFIYSVCNYYVNYIYDDSRDVVKATVLEDLGQCTSVVSFICFQDKSKSNKHSIFCLPKTCKLFYILRFHFTQF